MKKNVCKALMITATLSVAAGISGCGNKAANVKQETTTAAAFEDTFNTVTISGKEITLPISHEKLKELGLSLDDTENATISENNFGYGYINENGDAEKSCLVEYRHKDADTKELKDCDAVAFYWAVDSGKGMDISFMGGINEHSTKEEISAKYDQLYSDETGAITVYGKKLSDESGLEITFEEDTLVSISAYVRDAYVKKE